MNQHKLIMDKKLIKRDYESTQHLPPEQCLRYQLMYQMTRLTSDRGSLSNDDRLDALAIAVQYWVEHMSQDVDKRMQVRREEQLMAEVNRMKDLSKIGLAIVTGHNLKDKTTMKW